ncbi:MAG: alpha-E domain-containing protein [Synechococcales cyanobacterium CRU_2_2]|nr:alpha-E domain-containing protein [Synechococcales cyanobacterium CRU_2_2]
MLSRVADSIYWLNRYVERAENVARFIDVNLNLLLDSPPGSEQQWKPILETTGDMEIFQKRYGQFDAETVLHFLTFDPGYRSSIFSCLLSARDNARSVREIISSEMWEQVNEFYMMVREASKQPLDSLLRSSNFFDAVKQASHLFEGIMDSTMSHGEGWHFGQVGRLLERADKTSRILDVKYFILLPSVDTVGTAMDEIQWMALLKSASAYEMYRKHQGDHRISPSGVAEFLMLDPDFPRAIRSCLLQAQGCLHQITGTPLRTWRNPAERSLGKLCAELDYITIEEIIDRGLHEFLNDVQIQVNEIGHHLFDTFFLMDSPA